MEGSAPWRDVPSTTDARHAFHFVACIGRRRKWNERARSDVQGKDSRTLGMPATLSSVTEPLSDAQLLALARDGDGNAFRQIVDRYEPVVAATVIGMLGRGDDADDVGQETFVRFHRAIGAFREESALKTYLVRIAMNLSLNALKQRKRRGLRFLSRDSDRDIPVAIAPAPDVPLDETQERQDIVNRAVLQLREKHRAVVTLRLLQGLSVRETAQALDIPEGTVLSRLARATEQLRTALQPYIRDGRTIEVRR